MKLIKTLPLCGWKKLNSVIKQWTTVNLVQSLLNKYFGEFVNPCNESGGF